MSIELIAELRDVKGKSASRRLRHVNKVPAIVYGAGKEPQNIMLEQKDVQYVLPNEAVYSQVLSLNIAGKKEDVLLRDLQHHPCKIEILHMDFMRVDAKKAVHVHVPLHFIGEENSPGVKTEGGQVSHVVMEIEVECLPKDIPSFIEVDLSEMHLGDIVHLSEIKLPAGVESLVLKHGADHDTAVANIHLRKVDKAESEEADAAEAAAGAAAAEEKDKEKDKE